MTVPSWVVNVWCSRPVCAELVPGVETGEVETGGADGEGEALSSPHDAAIKVALTHIASAARAAPNCFIRSFCRRVETWRSASARQSLSTTGINPQPSVCGRRC